MPPRKIAAQKKRVVSANPAPRAVPVAPPNAIATARFYKPATPPPRVGSPRNRAQGPMPVRLETMVMQIGPSALHLLRDVIDAVIPGVTIQQRIDSATTIVQMMTEISNAQMSAWALLTRNLDYSKLSDAQLMALQEHQHDVSAAVAALTDTLHIERIP